MKSGDVQLITIEEHEAMKKRANQNDNDKKSTETGDDEEGSKVGGESVLESIGTSNESSSHDELTA